VLEAGVRVCLNKPCEISHALFMNNPNADKEQQMQELINGIFSKLKWPVSTTGNSVKALPSRLF
jgi:hypothetical protein